MDDLDQRGTRRERESDEKARLAERLSREGSDDLAAVLDACGQLLRLVCLDCTGIVSTVTRCRKRWCPCCASLLSYERQMRYGRAASMLRWPLHITLTILNVTTITSETLRLLLHGFRKLRQRRLWRDTVTGGWVNLEVTNRGNGWHPHLHILADVQWLALQTREPRRCDSRDTKLRLCREAATELSDEWANIVGQETASVKSRRCAGEEAAREVMKYAVKPGDLLRCKGSASELIRALKGRRLFRPFGNQHGRRIDDDDETENAAPCACSKCGATGSLRPEHVAAMILRGSR